MAETILAGSSVRIITDNPAFAPGATHGRLTVIGPPFSVGYKHRVVVRCECGAVYAALANHTDLKMPKACKSCSAKNNNRKHGLHKSRLYGVWTSMRVRCRSKKYHAYHNYGGRGIVVCGEWDKSFDAFAVWANQNGYDDTKQLDRRDNSLGYSPDNCRFVSCQVNQNNKRTNFFVTAWGETKTISDWARDGRCSISKVSLRNRLLRGLEPEMAISCPSQRPMALAKLAPSIGPSRKRINR